MKLSESPIKPGTLTKLRELDGGLQGKVYLLENTAGEKLVVKFSKDKPAEAVAGTAIMNRVGVTTPGIRVASDAERSALAEAVNTAAVVSPSGVSNFDAKEFNRAANPKFYSSAHLMEYAQGQKIGDVRDKDLPEFLTVLGDPVFQAELGKIVAADAFAGNPDRMSGTSGNGQRSGWYNQGNLFLDSQARRLVAIDNAFRPQVNGFGGLQAAAAPWGGTGFNSRWGSIASACDKLAQEEARLLFDKLLDTARTSHPTAAATIDAAAAHRDEFVENFTKGATVAMRDLLMRGQHWGAQLATWGAEEKMLAEFRVRKRVLRQVRAGEDPAAALARAENANAYRKWVLTKELNEPEDKADAILNEGVGAYKTHKLTH